MALVYFAVLALLHVSNILGGPLGEPFEVYGPPPGDVVSPVYTIILPQVINVTPSHNQRVPQLPNLKSYDQHPPSQEGFTISPEHTEVHQYVLSHLGKPSHPELALEVAAPHPEHSDTAPDNRPQVINVQDKSGQYSFGINQPGPEGQIVKEQGRLITTNEGWEYVIAKKGSYSYQSPEGIPVIVEWEADHNGFRILKTTV